MDRKNLKKYMAAAAAIACAAAVGIGTTMAYMTEKDEVTNVFTVGDLDVGLKEPEWDPEDGDGINMYPGYTVYKNPTVKNITSDRNGEEPCYARMLIHIQDEDGNLIEDPEAIELVKETIRFDSSYTGNYEEKGAGSVLTQGRVPGYALEELKDIPMVNPDFTLDKARSEPNVLVYNYMGKDGAGILKIGEEAALFTHIVIPTDWNQTHFEKVGDFQLSVTLESIQASGFSSQADAFLALDEEIGNGTIQGAEDSEEDGADEDEENKDDETSEEDGGNADEETNEDDEEGEVE